MERSIKKENIASLLEISLDDAIKIRDFITARENPLTTIDNISKVLENSNVVYIPTANDQPISLLGISFIDRTDESDHTMMYDHARDIFGIVSKEFIKSALNHNLSSIDRKI